MDVKLVCAWCERHMAGDEDCPRVSHGLCPICLREMLERLHANTAKVDHSVDMGGEG